MITDNPEEEKLHILVVDDECLLAKTIADILHIKGYGVETAFNGSEAVKMVGRRSFDAVLMDIKMPELNGVAAFLLIKTIAPELPVVMMTAYSTDVLVSQARAQGALGILPKPLDINALLAFLSTLEKELGIFIIDDDHDFCRTVTGVLQKRNFKAHYETDAFNAMEYIKREEGVVLLDMKLKRISGLDVLRKIRDENPHLPVILVTGYRDEMRSLVEKGLELNAFAYLYKPLDMNKLFSLLDRIKRKKLRHALGER